MISIKKVATVGAAAGLLLASAVPAFAWGGGWNDDDLVVNQGNNANIQNGVLSVANSGANQVGGGKFVAVKTGNAGAYAGVSNVANKNVAVVASCNCFDDVTVNQGNNATVTNHVGAIANTGLNSVGGGKIVLVKTGNAGSEAVVTNVVNKNVAVVN